MALKHYGGAKPEPVAEWTCPSCQAVNATPLKAGCQSCGAGADARKADGPQPPLVGPRVATPPTPEQTAVDAAINAWIRLRRLSIAEQVLAAEAFMAGVAWGKAQPAGGGPYDPNHPTTTLDAVTFADVPLQALDAPSLATIIAALTFYRDNQLQYGPLPGQLTATQVTDLIARLSPQESEA